jgi:type I restriction enzyme S subunit
MKRYDSYKDSGVEWIGEVPSHWDLVPLKRLLVAPMLYGANEPAESDDPMNPRYIRITDINENGKLRPETFKSLEFSKAKDYLLKRGDILFARSGSVGKTYMFDEDIEACFAGYLIKATCNKHKLLPKYLYFYTLSGAYGSWIHSAFSQSTIQNISASKYESLILTIPSIVEQLSIATYLDTKCAEIDHIISAQQKRIALLQELKQSVITRAVTKGLNPNVEMKESGVEWIGQVPGHWEGCRIKNFVTICTTSSSSPNKIGLENIESKTGKFIKTDTEYDGNGVQFKKNSIVYGKLRPYLQKVWLAEFEGNAVGDFFVFSAKSNSVPSFIKYLMLSDGFTKEADGSTFGAKMPRVSSEFILTMHYCLPPLSEQSAIATYLDQCCASIDLSITKAQRQIALLEEYKQSLITEVVTGKRKVC